MRAQGLLSLILTGILCLPSLAGGITLMVNLFLHQAFEEWNQTSSAVVALAVFISGPLVLMAAVIGILAILSRGVSLRIKYAHLLLVLLAALSTMSIWFRFSM